MAENVFIEESDALEKLNKALISQLQNGITCLKNTSKNTYVASRKKRNVQNTSTPKNVISKVVSRNHEFSFQEKQKNCENNYNTVVGVANHNYSLALNDQGNLRQNLKDNDNDNCVSHVGIHHPKSILCSNINTRNHRNKIRSTTREEEIGQYNNDGSIFQIEKLTEGQQTPRKAKVCFSSSTEKKRTHKLKPLEKTIDTSMIGYDWIAHMIDNKSYIDEQSDEFFHNIDEFRRENLQECKFIDKKRLINEDIKQPQALYKSIEVREEEGSSIPLCCTGNGAYTLNKRCNLVPIHGPYSACSVCKTKPRAAVASSAYQNSHIRVSIPRSTLQSPYQIKHHRRRSFDPSDSVSLSSHCLAGWQNSKPAYAPGPSNIDLQSHTANTRFASINKSLKEHST